MNDSAVDELARLVRWNGRGIEGVDWHEAEREVGFPIPASFKDYVARFPAGEFQTYLSVQQLLSATDLEGYARNVRSDLKALRVVAKYSSDFTYGIFPTTPGLVPWGRVHGDYFFCWYLAGASEVAPTIVLVDSDDGSTEAFEGTIAEFVIAVLQGRFPELQYVTEECDPPCFHVREYVSSEERRPYGRATDHRDLNSSGILTVYPESPDALDDLIGLDLAASPQSVDWVALEQRLRHPLPSDYKRLIETLGPGIYGDIMVANPGGSVGEIPGLLDLTAEALDSLNRNAEVPTPVGPITWGRAPEKWYCGWVPGNDATDQRPVMLFHPTLGANGFRRSMTSYLAWHVQDPSDWEGSLWRVGEPE